MEWNAFEETWSEEYNEFIVALMERFGFSDEDGELLEDGDKLLAVYTKALADETPFDIEDGYVYLRFDVAADAISEKVMARILKRAADGCDSWYPVEDPRQMKFDFAA